MIFKINNKTVSYNPTPKCACSTVKAMLMEASNDKELCITENNFEFVHEKNATRIFYKEEADYKFCIIRDPVERFVSGYSNRVLYHRDISFFEFDYFLKNFLDFYRIYPKINHHFSPQVAFIGTDPEYYDRIFWISELNELGERLTEIAGKKIEPKRLQTGGSDKKPALTAQQKETIKQIYKNDYLFLEQVKK